MATIFASETSEKTTLIPALCLAGSLRALRRLERCWREEDGKSTRRLMLGSENLDWRADGCVVVDRAFVFLCLDAGLVDGGASRIRSWTACWMNAH